jgi:hypothetical protein
MARNIEILKAICANLHKQTEDLTNPEWPEILRF